MVVFHAPGTASFEQYPRLQNQMPCFWYDQQSSTSCFARRVCHGAVDTMQCRFLHGLGQFCSTTNLHTNNTLQHKHLQHSLFHNTAVTSHLLLSPLSPLAECIPKKEAGTQALDFNRFFHHEPGSVDDALNYAWHETIQAMDHGTPWSQFHSWYICSRGGVCVCVGGATVPQGVFQKRHNYHCSQEEARRPVCRDSALRDDIKTQQHLSPSTETGQTPRRP